MTTAYFSHHSVCGNHRVKAHPESPDRLTAIEQGLAVLEIDQALDRRLPPEVALELVRRVHDPFYIDQLVDMAPVAGELPIDADTALTPGTLAAARRAVGAGVAAVDVVLAGEVTNAFCAVRPPGHHAEYARAMGFCFFGNVAVAARYALEVHGLERVAILDFDVHHGNGTEDLLRDEPRVLFCSTYQNPLFPFTDDRSVPGRLVKTPLNAGAGGAVFRRAIERDWLPAVDSFCPELILVSAGFDAHRADPLADLLLETGDFAWVTQRIADMADRHCDGRIISMLEGGYALDALAASAAVHIRELLTRGD